MVQADLGAIHVDHRRLGCLRAGASGTGCRNMRDRHIIRKTVVGRVVRGRNAEQCLDGFRRIDGRTAADGDKSVAAFFPEHLSAGQRVLQIRIRMESGKYRTCQQSRIQFQQPSGQGLHADSKRMTDSQFLHHLRQFLQAPAPPNQFHTRFLRLRSLTGIYAYYFINQYCSSSS